jgi:Rrf2 family protein
MQSLSRGRLVNSQRGINGGFTLIGEPGNLCVLEVIDAVDPIRRFQGCPLGMHGVDLCPLHNRIEEATQLVEQIFRDTTIADLLKAPRSKKPLCRFPEDESP